MLRNIKEIFENLKKMMRKIFFLRFTLYLLPFTLFLLQNVTGKAQVAIGKAESPHPDAILELKSNSRGLLLPQVSLKGVTDFLVNGGDKESAKGMLVYNTGERLDGPGLYVWTGSFWQSCKPGECPFPGKPVSISFSPALAGTIVANTLITVTAGLAYGASTFEWTVPEGFEIVSNVNARSIQMKAKQSGTFPASLVTVKAVNFAARAIPFEEQEQLRWQIRQIRRLRRRLLCPAVEDKFL
jgi:hypothetical protein